MFWRRPLYVRILCRYFVVDVLLLTSSSPKRQGASGIGRCKTSGPASRPRSCSGPRGVAIYSSLTGAIHRPANVSLDEHDAITIEPLEFS